MFKSNKKRGASLVIIIISIVVAVLILATVAGIIIWKVVGSEESSKDKRDREKESEYKVGADGFVDCGISTSFLQEFDEITDIDFNRDSAMVCMGENIKDDCKNAKSLVKTDDFDFNFKASGESKSDCRVRLEVYDEGEFLYLECPLSGLISIPELFPDYQELKTQISGDSGDYAGAILLVGGIIMWEGDWQAASYISCTRNFD